MKEMNDPKKKLRRNIRWALIGDILTSMYLAGMFNTAFHTFNLAAALNPFSHLKQAMQTGWPIWLFLILFIFIGSALAYLILQSIKDLEGMDKMGRLFKQTTKRQSYGAAHFEEPEEYKRVASIQSAGHAYGTIVGQIGDNGTKLVNTRMDNNRSNRNIAVVGASGSGKTFTFSKPFCYQCAKRRESIIITDPDGGLYRDTAGFFQDQGYIVRRFDLSNLDKSDGWDCMKAISSNYPDIDAQIFAETAITNSTSGNTEPIYIDAPKSLLKALILRVFLGQDYAPEQKNIETVYSLLQHPQGEEFLEMLFDDTLLSESEKPCLGPYLAFKQAGGNLRGNIITNLATQLQLFQNKLVCKVLTTDDIDLLLPGQKPCAYYCLFPDSHSTYSVLVSLFFSMLFQSLIAYADQECGGSLPVPVNFLLDEFPSIGRLPDWDRKMATIRKRNINAVMIFQNIRQLQNLYDTTWVTILSNCATMVNLGINDGDTADLVSKRIGDTTIQAKTEQHPINEALLAFDHANSTGEGRRALLSYDELHKLDIDDCIVIFQNHNPVWLRKYPHTLHPSSKLCRTIMPSSIPSIYDTEGRAKLREEETLRIEEYYKHHPSVVDRNYEGLCESDPVEEPNQELKSKAQKAVLWTADKIDQLSGASPVPPQKNTAEEEFVITEEISFELVRSAPAEEQAPETNKPEPPKDIDISITPGNNSLNLFTNQTPQPASPPANEEGKPAAPAPSPQPKTPAPEATPAHPPLKPATRQVEQKPASSEQGGKRLPLPQDALRQVCIPPAVSQKYKTEPPQFNGSISRNNRNNSNSSRMPSGAERPPAKRANPSNSTN